MSCFILTQLRELGMLAFMSSFCEKLFGQELLILWDKSVFYLVLAYAVGE